MLVLIGLSRIIKAPIAVTVAGCCKKTSAIFVFADLTPDGFHFWMTLSPRTSEPVRHAPVPPLEQNSDDVTVHNDTNYKKWPEQNRGDKNRPMPHAEEKPNLLQQNCALDPIGEVMRPTHILFEVTNLRTS